MSQEEVFKILKELGGEATTKAISEKAKKKFPGLSLHMYVFRRLRRLELYGFVETKRVGKKNKWKIIKEYS